MPNRDLCFTNFSCFGYYFIWLVIFLSLFLVLSGLPFLIFFGFALTDLIPISKHYFAKVVALRFILTAEFDQKTAFTYHLVLVLRLQPAAYCFPLIALSYFSQHPIVSANLLDVHLTFCCIIL